MKVRIMYDYNWDGVVEIDNVKTVEEARQLFSEAVANGELEDKYNPKEFPAGNHTITSIKEVK